MKAVDTPGNPRWRLVRLFGCIGWLAGVFAPPALAQDLAAPSAVPAYRMPKPDPGRIRVDGRLESVYVGASTFRERDPDSATDRRTREAFIKLAYTFMS